MGVKMDKMQGIFNILKGVVDNKVPDLKRKVAAGDSAQKKFKSACASISNIEQCIITNRTDKSYVKELEESLDEYNAKLPELSKTIDIAKTAQENLTAANSFYNTYNQFMNGKKLKELQEQYRQLDSVLLRLEDNIFACEVNMDSSQRSIDVCQQSERDFEYYNLEYDRVVNEMSHVLEEIRLLKR